MTTFRIEMMTALELLSQVADASIHFVITDPPYFIDGMAEGWEPDLLTRRTATSGTVGGLPGGMRFCSDQGPRLQAFMEPIAAEIFRVMKPGGFLIFFCQGRLLHRMTIAFENSGFQIRDMLAWARFGQAKAQKQEHHIRRHVRKGLISPEEGDHLIASLAGRKTPQLAPYFEPMSLAMKPLEGTHVENWIRHQTGLIDTCTSLDGKFPSNLMHVAKPCKKERGSYNTHLTVKPADLIEHLVRIFSIEGQVVLDPFMGSGSHGIGAIRAQRNFIGCEPVPEYFSIAEKRLAENCPEARRASCIDGTILRDEILTKISGDNTSPSAIS